MMEFLAFAMAFCAVIVSLFTLLLVFILFRRHLPIRYDEVEKKVEVMGDLRVNGSLTVDDDIYYHAGPKYVKQKDE